MSQWPCVGDRLHVPARAIIVGQWHSEVRTSDRYCIIVCTHRNALPISLTAMPVALAASAIVYGDSVIRDARIWYSYANVDIERKAH